MIKINFKKQSNYPVSALNIKKRLTEFLTQKGLVSDTLVDVSIVGKKVMLNLAKKYLKEENVLRNVLSFPENEVLGQFVYPHDEKIRLGEIVICYPKVFEEAREENKLIDEKVYELVEHGARHLLGEHH